ncbi:MAG: 3-dehydroquinate synthase [Phycisphaerae bacterium]|nr:3-dehydroquinate synthase [Phycisphaerae bacterium]
MPELAIHVPAQEQRTYRVRIGTGLLACVAETVGVQFPHQAPFVITDRNVARAGHLDRLAAGRNVPCFVIDPPGEQSKHVRTVAAIVEAMDKAQLGRDTVVLALGGGTVGDIGAFAASIFKRGVPVVQVPTTALAQADSAIGGKTGVDSSVSKNALGTFWHPAAVYMDVETHRTVDERQFRAGLVESVKHAVIADAGFFESLEGHLDAILSREPAALEAIAERNCRIKGRVVEQDPQEQNLRRVLNYGHTIGHAVESASRYRVLHGEAVAIGMVCAGRIEIEMGLGTHDRLHRVVALLERIGVPTRIPSDIPAEEVLRLLGHDKKATDMWPRFVLTSRVGQVHCPDGQWAVPVGREVVARVLNQLY